MTKILENLVSGAKKVAVCVTLGVALTGELYGSYVAGSYLFSGHEVSMLSPRKQQAEIREFESAPLTYKALNLGRRIALQTNDVARSGYGF